MVASANLTLLPLMRLKPLKRHARINAPLAAPLPLPKNVKSTLMHLLPQPSMPGTTKEIGDQRSEAWVIAQQKLVYTLRFLF